MSTTIPFPRQMKRGPKVRRGPCAQVFPFPAPLTGAALRAEWTWLRANHHGWDHEQLPSSCDLESIDEAKFERDKQIDDVTRTALGKKPRTEADMRREIAEWRAEITKRVQVKDWLETLGVNWRHAFEPERALFFAFDRLQADEQPARA